MDLSYGDLTCYSYIFSTSLFMESGICGQGLWQAAKTTSEEEVNTGKSWDPNH